MISSKKIRSFFLFALVLWIFLSIFNIFYNSIKVIAEVQEWGHIPNVEKRHKIFGDLYDFFIFVNKYTNVNSTILVYAQDVRTFYLGRYYLYPRHIVVANNKDEISEKSKSNSFQYIAIFNDTLAIKDYKIIASFSAEKSFTFGTLYKLK